MPLVLTQQMHGLKSGSQTLSDHDHLKIAAVHQYVHLLKSQASHDSLDMLLGSNVCCQAFRHQNIFDDLHDAGNRVYLCSIAWLVSYVSWGEKVPKDCHRPNQCFLVLLTPTKS